MRFIRALSSLTASAISRGNRNRQLRKINKANVINRNLSKIGRVSSERLFPELVNLGNICISGQDENARRKLVIQSVKNAVSLNQPVIILHEGDISLENELLNTLQVGNRSLKVINKSNPYYEPFLKLTNDEIASLIAASSSYNQHKISDEGRIYLKAIMKLLRKCSITPYTKKISSCPHATIQHAVISAESAGALTHVEAEEIRNDINLGVSARPAIEYFFSELSNEDSIIADRNRLSNSTSINECIRSNGMIVLDVESMSYSSLLSIIVAELFMASKKYNKLIRFIVSANSLSQSDALKKLFKTSSNMIQFTISTEDIGNFAGTDKSDVEALIAVSNRIVLFSHGVHSSELLSTELGEYDFIEAHLSHTGNTGFGGFGIHFGANNTIKPEHKRERVIQPEEIEHLKEGDFILLDNSACSLHSGTLV